VEAPEYRCLPFDDASALPADARVLHFLRHGESLHQVRNAEAEARGAGCRCFEAPRDGDRQPEACPYWADDLIDSPLTELGRRQILDRGTDLAVDRVLASPMARTLETSLLAFASHVPIVAVPELRPRVGRHMHSKCSPRSSLARRFPRVDLTRIEHEDDRVWSPETEPREALEQRAAQFLELVFAHPDQRIAVVTHFTVLLALLLPADDPFTLGPSQRPPRSPALLDGSGCPDPEALRVPVKVGEARSLLVARRARRH
jgi:broad specificity phosphatase PhoE